jgi:pentatricopeptide repeat protein
MHANATKGSVSSVHEVYSLFNIMGLPELQENIVNDILLKAYSAAGDVRMASQVFSKMESRGTY